MHQHQMLMAPRNYPSLIIGRLWSLGFSKIRLVHSLDFIIRQMQRLEWPKACIKNGYQTGIRHWGQKDDTSSCYMTTSQGTFLLKASPIFVSRILSQTLLLTFSWWIKVSFSASRPITVLASMSVHSTIIRLVQHHLGYTTSINSLL